MKFAFCSTLVGLLGAFASATHHKPAQTYFIPLPEESLLEDLFKNINSGARGPVVSIISFAISTNDTVIWYDHWEGGYESDPTKPVANTIEVWGDQNATNGCPPDVKPCNDASDFLRPGDTIVVQNSVPVPRNKNQYDGKVLYDGGDIVYSSYPITVTRGAYPTTPGSVMAGGVEVYDVGTWGTTFTAPIGENVTRPNSKTLLKSTEYCAVYVMASEDGTEIVVNGDLKNKHYLGKGDALDLRVKMGDIVNATKPIQVDLLTGDLNSGYSLRWFSLLPAHEWSTDYTTPVGDTDGGTKVMMYNDNSVETIVDVTFRDGTTYKTTPVTLPAKGYNFSPIIPSYSGAQLVSKENLKFLALSFTDAEELWTGGQWFDWGFPVVPTNMLSSQVLVGWGYGCTNNLCPVGEVPRSVVWVTAVEDADVYVDYLNDGVSSKYEKIPVKRLEGLRLRDMNDTKKDMSGAIIFATKSGSGVNGTTVDIAAAWGQDPSVSKPNQPISLDLGTTVLPFPSLRVTKKTDKSFVGPGETLRYTISLMNVGQRSIPAGSITVVDPTFAHQIYVPGSTTFSSDKGLTFKAIPDDLVSVAGSTSFPLDGAGLKSFMDLDRRGGIHEFSFDVIVNENSLNTTMIHNAGYVKSLNTIKPFSVSTPIKTHPMIKIENTVYSGHDNGASCGNPDIAKEVAKGVPHTKVTYCYKVINTGKSWLKNPVITNKDLKSVHEKANFVLRPGQSYTIHYDKVQTDNVTPVEILGDLLNVAEVAAVEIWPNGAVKDPTAPLIRHKDDSRVLTEQFNPSVKVENLVFTGDGDCVTKGAKLASGLMNESVTYCFTVTNTGNSHLKTMIVTNDNLKPVFSNTRDALLGPSQSYVLKVQGVIDGNYTNVAKVIATPTLPDGTVLTQYPQPTDDDDSAIEGIVRTIDVRSGTKDPFLPPVPDTPDKPTLCMTPHWRDAGGKQDLICRANDITVKSITSNRANCKEGDMVTITADAKLLFKTGLYDPAWFVATDGGDAKLGSCVLKGLTPDKKYTVTDPDGIDGDVGMVAWNADAIGGPDKCGDVIITGGAGLLSTPFLVKAEMKCTDTNDDGNMDFSVCFSWRKRSTDSFCTLTNDDVDTQGSLADVFPYDNMKCRCVRVELPTVSVEKKTTTRAQVC